MKKAIIIYYSKTGFTQRYANWLAEELGCACISYEERDQVKFEEYEAVVFGSWLHAGGIQKLKWLKDQAAGGFAGRLAVFAVGAAPLEGQDMKRIKEQNFTQEEGARIPLFYLPGGISYEKMGAGSKLMMKMFSTMIAKKKNKTKEELVMAEMICRSYDISDRKFLKPLENYLEKAFTEQV